MKTRLLLFTVVGLAACTTSVKTWTRPDTTQGANDHDLADCKFQAKKATASYSSTPPSNSKTDGMGTAVGDGVVIAEKQIDLTNDCMRLKGYQGQ
jgi:hypothetical protein